MRTKLSTFLAALCCLAGTSAWAADYTIASADDLVAFAAAVNGGETDANATLTADIDMSEHSWTPIGDAEGMAFKGTIDGGGFAISNLVMDAATENGFCGFIAQATRGTVIKNLTIDATCSFTNANNYTGAFICRGVAGDGSAAITFTDCVNKAKVTSTKKWTAGFVAHTAVPVNFTNCTNEGAIESFQLPAGFVGQTTATLNFADCTNKGAVTATQAKNENGGSNAAGFLAHHTTQGAHLSFTNCVNEGAIYSKGSRAAGFGGNVNGQNTACTLKNCVNRGKITSEIHLPAGFFGSAYIVLDMTDCVNEGEIVTVNGNSNAAQMAGFVGTTTSGCVFRATRCYNTGKINANGKENAGAFVGYHGNLSQVTLTNCYNAGDISTASKQGHAFIGYGGDGPTNIKIYNCWNSGATQVTSGYTLSYDRGSAISKTTMENSYDLVNTDATWGATTLISGYEESWKESGALTYYINDKAGSTAYYQTLGTDPMPTLDDTHGIVYVVGTYRCDGTLLGEEGERAYSNTADIPEHTYANGLCSVCEKSVDPDYLVDGKFPISNAVTMSNFGKAVNVGYTTLSAYLTADINMDGQNWTAPTKTYTATFDGKGYTIQNLGAPLFANTGNGVAITDLTLEGSFIGTAVSNASTGAFIAYHSGNVLTLKNCWNQTDITNSTAENTGGIVGRIANINAANGLNMTGCVNTGSITGNESLEITNNGTGGLIGWASFPFNGLCAVFTDCENRGAVTGGRRVGGIIGYCSYGNNAHKQDFVHCINSGAISGTTMIGGLVGLINSTTNYTDCENSGTVTGSTAAVGGIVGRGTGDTAYGQQNFTRCYNSGDVSSTGGSEATANCQQVGGILGFTAKPVTMTECINTGDITAQYGIGGLAGQINSGTTTTITRCFNVGNIVREASSATEANTERVGSFVGLFYNTTVNLSDCYNIGSVTDNRPYYGKAESTVTANVANCYDINGGEEYFEAIEAEEAVSGELCYKLNQGAGETIYFQKLGEGGNAYPVFIGEDIVYFDGENYTNTPSLPAGEDGFYEIRTPQDLVTFSTMINTKAIANTSSAIIMADLDMTGINFQPIGFVSAIEHPSYQDIDVINFRGIIDGQNHIIENLTIVDTLYHEAGLVSRLDYGTIKNLGVVNASVTTNNPWRRASVFAGFVNHNGTLENCFATGEIELNANPEDYGQAAGQDGRGGLVGAVSGCIMNNCYISHSKILAMSWGSTLTNCYWGDNATGDKLTSGELTYNLNQGAGAFVYFQGAEYPSFQGNYVAKIADNGYGTFFVADDAITAPEGVTAYTGKIQGDMLAMTAVEGAIPAGTAVVLAGEPGFYGFAPAAEAEAIAENDLQGTAAPLTADGTQYILAEVDGTVGFYQAQAQTQIPFAKAFLNISEAAGAKGYKMVFGDATGINEMTTDNRQQTTVIYDLQGRRVEKATKGIYIVNGKKVLK